MLKLLILLSAGFSVGSYFMFGHWSNIYTVLGSFVTVVLAYLLVSEKNKCEENKYIYNRRSFSVLISLVLGILVVSLSSYIIQSILNSSFSNPLLVSVIVASIAFFIVLLFNFWLLDPIYDANNPDISQLTIWKEVFLEVFEKTALVIISSSVVSMIKDIHPLPTSSTVREALVYLIVFVIIGFILMATSRYFRVRNVT